MKKRLNQKGFTLVELLAVLVILIAIMGIAIPTISSSLERTKANQNKAHIKVLETAAEMYVTDNKNNIYDNLGNNNSCYIELSSLEKYLPDDATKDADNNDMSGVVLYTKPNTYKYEDSRRSGVASCQSQEPAYTKSESQTSIDQYTSFLLTTSFEYDAVNEEFNLTGEEFSINLVNWYRNGMINYRYTCSLDGNDDTKTCKTLYEFSNYNNPTLEYYTYTTK